MGVAWPHKDFTKKTDNIIRQCGAPKVNKIAYSSGIADISPFQKTTCDWGANAMIHVLYQVTSSATTFGAKLSLSKIRSNQNIRIIWRMRWGDFNYSCQWMTPLSMKDSTKFSGLFFSQLQTSVANSCIGRVCSHYLKDYYGSWTRVVGVILQMILNGFV